MPVRYDQDTKARAIRLVREHAGDYPSEYAAITAVAGRLGMSAETLRKWIRQAAVDEGQAPGVSSEAEKQIRELKRKVSELERTIEILSAATGFSRGSTTRYAVDLRVHRRSPGPVRGRADLPCPWRAGHRDRSADVLGAPVPAAVAAGAEG
jgi:transposase